MLYWQQPLLRVIDYLLSQLLPTLSDPAHLLALQTKPASYHLPQGNFTPAQISALLESLRRPSSPRISVRV